MDAFSTFRWYTFSAQDFNLLSEVYLQATVDVIADSVGVKRSNRDCIIGVPPTDKSRIVPYHVE